MENGEWRMRREAELSNADRIQEVEENPQSSTLLFGIDPSLHNGKETGDVGKTQSIKASSFVLVLFLLRHHHADH